jgi:hypothetical protein
MRHTEVHAVLDGLLDAGEVRRLPELPNFGIFYLNIPTAAALIVEDLKRSGRRATFGVEEGGDETLAEREKHFAKRITELIADLEARLLNSVERGKLRYCNQSRILEDFLQRGDQQFVPEYTYIHYSDLVRWLTEFGYVDQHHPNESPAFEEYERNELDLLENIENDTKVRRDQLGIRIQSYMRLIAPPASEEDAQLRLQERLAEALELNQQLARENQALKASVEQSGTKPINENSKRSYLRMIATLCRVAKIDTHNRETTALLEKKTKDFNLALNNSTVRKMLREVIEESARSEG